jgi:Holliday junction DNA helicase RuvA
VIAGVRGILEAAGEGWVIVGVGGVSLRVSVPTTTATTLGSIGSGVHLHTHLLVREEEVELYGFATREALQLFQLLMTVNGVGPRLALALLGSLQPEALILALAAGDVKRLQQTPGIGRKTAERLVLELREKLSRGYTQAPVRADAAQDDALAALVSLGYSIADAAQALKDVPPAGEALIEERVRLALRRLAGG